MSSSLSPIASPSRTVTELDYVRISNMVRRLAASGEATPSVGALMDFADLVPSREVAPDVVTMYTRVAVLDPVTRVRRELTVCYPPDADVGTGCVSVLSPVGGALLGMSVGAIATWTTPDGHQERAQVQAILFQPEASGDFTA